MTDAARADPPPRRPYGVLRLLLALMVALQHLQYLLPDAARWPFRTAGLGVIAVGVFFTLSGCIVTEALRRFYRGRPLAFLVNRLLRLVPPYVAAVLLSAVVQQALWSRGVLRLWDYGATGPPLTPRALLGAIASLVPGTHAAGLEAAFAFIPFVWTLRVEIAFYLAAAAMAVRPPARLGARAAHGALAAGALLFAVIARAGGQPPGIAADAPFLLLGVSLALPAPRGDRIVAVARTLAVAAAMLGFLAWGQDPMRRRDVQIALLLPLIAMLVALSRCAVQRRGWTWLDRHAGDLSYPLYLNHYVVGITLFDLIPTRSIALYVIGVLASVALAAVMHRLVEVPLTRLRRYVRGSAV